MERVRVRLKIYNLYQIMIFMDLKYTNIYTKCPIKTTNSSEMKKFKRASRSRGVARPRAGKRICTNCIRWRIVTRARTTTLYDARAQSSRKVHKDTNNHGCQGPREEDRRQEARREEAGGEEAGREKDDRQEDDRDEEEARGEEEAGGEEEARGEEEAGWYVKASDDRTCDARVFFFCVGVFTSRGDGDAYTDDGNAQSNSTNASVSFP